MADAVSRFLCFKLFDVVYCCLKWFDGSIIKTECHSELVSESDSVF